VPLTLRKTATHFKEKAQIFETKRPSQIILDEDVEAELGERRYYAHFCPAYDLMDSNTAFSFLRMMTFEGPVDQLIKLYSMHKEKPTLYFLPNSIEGEMTMQKEFLRIMEEIQEIHTTSIEEDNELLKGELDWLTRSAITYRRNEKVSIEYFIRSSKLVLEMMSMSS